MHKDEHAVVEEMKVQVNEVEHISSADLYSWGQDAGTPDTGCDSGQT